MPEATNGVYNAKSSSLPPHNLEAEQGVLGSILMDNSIYQEVEGSLRLEHFYRSTHQVIYRHIQRLIEKGVPADVLTLEDSLRETGDLERVGGLGYVFEILNCVPHAANGVFYSQIVIEKSLGRDIIQACSETLHDAYGQEHSVDEVLAKFEQRAFTLVTKEGGSNDTSTFEACGPVLKDLFDPAGAQRLKLKTGLKQLDNRLVALRKGALVVVGARPAMGKTALALRFAFQQQIHQKNVYMFSLEMTAEELAFRQMCAMGHVNGADVLNGNATDDDLRRLSEARDTLEYLGKLHVCGNVSSDLAYLSSTMTRAKTKYDVSLFVVDYLQLMEGNDKWNRNEQISKVTRRLKLVAQKLQTPVVLLSQLNREVEKRGSTIPKLADLRDSGSIEQDADAVLFLHRPEYYDPRDKPGVAEIHIAKQRNGPTGTVEVAFVSQYATFEDLDGRVDPHADVPPGF